ncbi:MULTISPECIES: 2-C-methyl-D-erythritol 2,4-cyclodiphosphate synthase [unclassified Arsukibacterium]|uniref:2-C-methyl-D-erythritol 2,4-cyclodiphosphate synthase n=1 Tax=unclassified Arsukibacterium TaxID=2635278 RepID=UPI000C4A7090|nr:MULTISPECIES: 2-C-methyl-D-erythritol 2,4-cyclodiphosphate synthase [unclassified Arsukibacterium]MAA95578.1 2-C-methyl-D-erythritol 2,4-cyclodiphosphate synthase [Rheinheimera sp.]MBM33840.1 2-C-methyl-D-erythritol 2,4-cyclodiphosphate synthase [Rheinheimera sp.]HAW93240.1 2-C-methyl-D-erythritol 2,4-cyclodiphosphate synthase [Candidatus Azambacteria bacterium]|tara:strand:- start:583 stop:1065 length:483 start_codon:yes stop_codon:yes gene_type:complete
MNFRIGHGFDVHAFGGPGPVILSGVKIDYAKGLVAHSDGDVVLHAVADAILGALGLGDIGHHFPDNDASYQGIDSRILLRQVFTAATNAGYQLNNLDITIMAQAPKIAPHINAMRQCLASDLAAEVQQINVKATTTEQLGFVGRKEGIAAEAVVLLVKQQ